MIDFHSHLLPQMDDGADSVAMSLAMLRRSFLQGVDLMVASSHFYADEEYPQDFLRRRNRSLQKLWEAMLLSPEVYPRVVPGAEVLYFPGISQAEEMEALRIGNSRCILIEPPMTNWTEDMLDEITGLGENFSLTPVIAHVDRYMLMLRDETLIDRVQERNLAVQVNASYFLYPKTAKSAIRNLKAGRIHLIGSDCHNLDSRAPNLDLAWKQAKTFGAEAEFKKLRQNALDLLLNGGELQ